MNTTTNPFAGTRRVTETASPTTDVTVQVVGDAEYFSCRS